MEKKIITTSEQKIISGKTRSLSKAEYSPKKTKKNQNGNTRDRSQLMALQDALRDPVTSHERF